MHIDVYAFADELTKIAESDNIVTKERALRALKGALGVGVGYGLGYGTGKMLSRTQFAQNLAAKLPAPVTMGLAGGGLSLLSQLAHGYLANKYIRYVKEGDKKPQDFLMGHHKLNPEHRKPV